jgi:hypothetical protein
MGSSLGEMGGVPLEDFCGWLSGKTIDWIGRTMRKPLRLAGRSVMKWSGIEFFSKRPDLDKARSLDELLATASDVSAILVKGRAIREQHLENAGRISRLLLPHPEAQSVRHYAKTVNDAYLTRHIAETTRVMLSKRTQVRWYPEMIHYSLMLGDPGKSAGWAHVECVLPYSRSNLRPSFTVKRRLQEGLVIAMSDNFERMWAASSDPDNETMNRILVSGSEGCSD